MVTITTYADGVELGYASYFMNEQGRAELCEERGIEDIPTTLPANAIDYIFDVFNLYQGSREWIGQAFFRITGKNSGVLELTIPNTGVIYQEFTIHKTEKGPRIQITRSSAVQNLQARIKSGVRRT